MKGINTTGVFRYNLMGHRIAKHACDKNPAFNGGLGKLVKSTYYVLDAQGNTISVYERVVNPSEASVTYAQAETHTYGSSRLGVRNTFVNVLTSTPIAAFDMASVTHKIGDKGYELNNHLGNVLSVISDKPMPHANGTNVDYYMADIRQSTDYSPFGAQLYGRNLTKNDPVTGMAVKDFRFGFQNQEEDDELKGEGNSVNYKYRMHDPRLGRFFAIDPLAGDYPHNSPYAFSENKVINARELEGLETAYAYVMWSNGKTDENGNLIWNKRKVDNYDNHKKFNERVYSYFDATGHVSHTITQRLDANGKVVSEKYRNVALERQIAERDAIIGSNMLKHEPGQGEYDWLDGNDNGANTSRTSAKGWKIAIKTCMAIATVGVSAEALLVTEAAGAVTTGVTAKKVWDGAALVYATDDLAGSIIGAANDTDDGQKPLKAVFDYSGMANVYNIGNLLSAARGADANLTNLVDSKDLWVSGNLFLDGWGLTDAATETKTDFTKKTK